MARKPASTDNITIGSTVFTSRTGRKSYKVIGFEVEERYPDVAPLVWAEHEGREMWFAMRELWT